MRTALPLLLLLAAQMAQAAEGLPRMTSICRYDAGPRSAALHTVECYEGEENARFYSGYDTNHAVLFRFYCGVANTANLYGERCKQSCRHALKGIRNYYNNGWTVVYGGTNIPGSGVGYSGVAFALWKGTCASLNEAVQERNSPGLKRPRLADLSDDGLISAGDDPDAGRDLKAPKQD